MIETFRLKFGFLEYFRRLDHPIAPGVTRIVESVSQSTKRNQLSDSTRLDHHGSRGVARPLSSSPAWGVSVSVRNEAGNPVHVAQAASLELAAAPCFGGILPPLPSSRCRRSAAGCVQNLSERNGRSRPNFQHPRIDGNLSNKAPTAPAF